ncbi:four helix bundle protein [Cerasicoccus frondis]|uniref:four helix bundle protein n=1 Tax=Cerasicoccus frondis TaxID=490090 RepID=UPI002852A690|nr:four helix bundle protein [Cerasicoccus frondis]
MNAETKPSAVRFTDLLVWQKAHAFVLSVYRMTADFPKHELYGLTSQFRRAAVSIPANIAEGFRKHGAKDKVRYMNIAQGSLEECRYYLILASDLNYLPENSMMRDLDEVGRMLNSYASKIASH